MKILLKQNDETYAVRDIIRLFIPLEKFEYVFDSSYDVLVSYEVKNNKHIFYCEYKKDILNTYSHTLEQNSYSKNYIKKCLFLTFLKAFENREKPVWGILTGIRPSKFVRELMDEGKNDSEITALLNEEYLLDKKKIELAKKIAKVENRVIKNIRDNSVSLYISIPFCPTRCLYCSFISQSLAYSKTLVEPYLKALEKEIKQTAILLKRLNKFVDSVYIGGGTPTSISASQLDKLITTLYKEFDLSKIKEFTVEAGRPDTIDKEKLMVIKNNNIERISINPQTFNDKTLKIIGRNHTAKETEEKFYLARSLGFNHINTDIIANLPGESVNDFEYTLEKIKNLNPESVTVHSLSIKHGSYLAEKYNMLNADTLVANKMIDLSIDYLENMGKIPYYIYRQKNTTGNLENIGFCNPDHECVYNIAIMQEVQTNIALGAGASTKMVIGDQIERAFNVKEVSEYIKRIDEMILRKENLFFN
ncbi:MAG: coproporphyrinogen dehydrogenase HemZ [Ruminococcaceae bacterium]|nr:coproporphyrinogen dehydrogenase HemZ [Oscillospiraceae bacterium]